jgi:hypothetical protein
LDSVTSNLDNYNSAAGTPIQQIEGLKLIAREITDIATQDVEGHIILAVKGRKRLELNTALKLRGGQKRRC